MTPSVLVLGLHYGGTSITSAIVEALGYHMGHCGKVNSTHPWGNKEDQAFLKWAIITAGNDIFPAPPTQERLDLLKRMVEKRDRRGRPWGVKLPLLDFYASWMLDCMESPKIVHVERDLTTASKSYAEKEGVPVEIARQIHMRYLAALYFGLEIFPDVPYYHFRYEDLIAYPSGEVSRLDMFLNDGTSSPSVLKSATELVLPDWKHF